MLDTADYPPRLRSLGFRVTAQRMAILRVLLESGSHLSPAEIYDRARRGARGLTPPTVYRTLDFLARYGLVQPALNSQRHLVYQIAGHEHHHVVCSRCGASVEIEHAAINHIYQDLQKRTGYHLTDSHVTLFGLCPACQPGATET
jgi:Fe2+ or Zn2+ uptake regulation protein